MKLTREELSDLLAKVEAATEPDRELDGSIALFCGWTHEVNHAEDYECWRNPDGKACYLPRYTASTDAALAPVDLVLPIGPMVSHELRHSLARDGEEFWNFRIKVYSDDEGEPPTVHWGTAWTAPLAILTALLRALREPSNG